MSIRHFTSHLEEIIAYTGDGSYIAKRLVLYQVGASGYVHATLLMMPPGTKVLSHWHDDREAVFYCVQGQGTLILDDVEKEAGPGTAMLQPLNAVHGVTGGQSEFHVLDFALFTETGVTREVSTCFTNIADRPAVATQYGQETALFDDFANPHIRFVGERHIDGQFTEADVPPGTEQIMLVLEGEGKLELLGQTMPLRVGSIMYLIANLPFRISGCVRTVGASSDPGRIPEPPLFDKLRSRTLP
jgi:quercetin dioxygenase-like cupin family protein